MDYLIICEVVDFLWVKECKVYDFVVVDEILYCWIIGKLLFLVVEICVWIEGLGVFVFVD